jgi:hypothetical protein
MTRLNGHTLRGCASSSMPIANAFSTFAWNFGPWVTHGRRRSVGARSSPNWQELSTPLLPHLAADGSVIN